MCSIASHATLYMFVYILYIFAFLRKNFSIMSCQMPILPLSIGKVADNTSGKRSLRAWCFHQDYNWKTIEIRWNYQAIKWPSTYCYNTPHFLRADEVDPSESIWCSIFTDPPPLGDTSPLILVILLLWVGLSIFIWVRAPTCLGLPLYLSPRLHVPFALLFSPLTENLKLI